MATPDVQRGRVWFITFVDDTQNPGNVDPLVVDPSGVWAAQCAGRGRGMGLHTLIVCPRAPSPPLTSPVPFCCLVDPSGVWAAQCAGRGMGSTAHAHCVPAGPLTSLVPLPSCPPHPRSDWCGRVGVRGGGNGGLPALRQGPGGVLHAPRGHQRGCHPQVCSPGAQPVCTHTVAKGRTHGSQGAHAR
jgi:hypothetical protein